MGTLVLMVVCFGRTIQNLKMERIGDHLINSIKQNKKEETEQQDLENLEGSG